MKTRHKLTLIVLLIALFSCSKKEENIMMKSRNYQNSNTYPQIQKDSSQAIKSITKQKLQEVVDLSVLYSQKNHDKEIDSTLYNQMLSYFYEPDSTTLKPFIEELDSLNVSKATIKNIENKELVIEEDTLNFVKFQLEYFGKRKEKISEAKHEMQYILVSTPIKFKKEFTFYFLNYFSEPIKDSTRLGVIK